MSIVHPKLAGFAAELNESYTKLVDKYWEDGLEHFNPLDLRVAGDGELLLRFWEEGIEFYPEVTK